MPQFELFPFLPSYMPTVADGVNVNESPVPGITLKRVLRGYEGWSGRIAWSPNGRFLAVPCAEKKILIWDISLSKCVSLLRGHTGPVISVAWSPDGRYVASASSDDTIRLWKTRNGKQIQTLREHINNVYDVSWSPNGRYLASADGNGCICLWNAINGKRLLTLIQHSDRAYSVAWSPNGKYFASASGDRTICLWSTRSGEQLKVLQGHSGDIYSVAWSPDGKQLASSSADGTVYIWNVNNFQASQVLEGHSGEVNCAIFSCNGRWLVSKGSSAIRLWRCDTWDSVAVISETISDSIAPSCAIHPKLSVLATFCEEDTGIRIWHINEDELLHFSTTDSVRYTTAKIVLVGDSGVGKTGLGWRLAHNHFKEHSSTHGQQFWVVEALCETRDDGTECEAVLWDLAGQHVYRPIHSIFLDNVDASLLLFDPTNRQDLMKGAKFWLEQLKGTKQLPPSILVGARMDRGGSTVSQEYLKQFCQQYDISGGYIGTSAKTGEGLENLVEQLKVQIPWDGMTTTVTTVTFKHIKDYVLALKERTDRKNILVQPTQLRQQLQGIDLDLNFTDDEMMTAVGHLETHGYVTILKSSAGHTHILLTPDLLVDLASSIVLLADKHPRELGAVNEHELLEGEYFFEELAGLEMSEQQIVLDAAILRFLEHNVCFRETLNDDTLLIFPGLIKQKRPLEDNFSAIDNVSYVVRGRVENLYATLVVLLGYTPSFLRINHWQKQAQYATGKNEICGFRMIEDREGEIELVLYYSDQMLNQGQEQFQELFERFLYQRDVEVTRFPPVACDNGHLLERTTVVARLRDNKKITFCSECGIKVSLPDFDQISIGTHASDWLKREEATAKLRSTYEQYLSRVKSYRRGWATPRCYLSYASAQKAYAQKLVSDLQDAGVYLITDVSDVQSDDYVVLLDTTVYQQLWAQPTPAFIVDKNIIQTRLNTKKLISLKLKASNIETTPHDLKGCTTGSFYDATHYPVSLFNLILDLYAIPLIHASFEPLRESLHKQWEQTLSHLPKEEMTSKKSPLKVFISYAHEDEARFKDKFVNMLGGLRRRGIISAWEDREIRPGDNWYQEIQSAMNTCDMAVLLISADFINSRFITEQEVPKLVARRQEEGMRVVPIIIRPCLWDSEPMFNELQALPKDGRPIITFPNTNGEREQAWTDIAKELEKFAVELQES